jgi:hypothetical protein
MRKKRGRDTNDRPMYYFFDGPLKQLRADGAVL